MQRYAVIDEYDQIYEKTLAMEANISIAKFMAEYGGGEYHDYVEPIAEVLTHSAEGEWQHLKNNRGYRCVKVEIKEIK